MEELEYELVWNGVNDGRDSDLFARDARVTEKRRGVKPTSREHTKYTEQVLGSLPYLQDEAVTFRELQIRTALPRGRLNSALCALRLQQRIASESVVIDGHYLLRYWRA